MSTDSVTSATLFQLAATALGTIILLIVGWGVNLLRGISKKQDDQAHELVEIRAVLLGVGDSESMVKKVEALHRWKNQQTTAALERATAEISRLNGVHVHTRATDLEG